MASAIAGNFHPLFCIAWKFGGHNLHCKQFHLTKPTDGCTKFQCQSALFNMGVSHEFGEGTTKSYAEARHLYERALAQGHTRAAEHLKRVDEIIRTECPLLGKRVSITGTSREDLNGRTGVVTSFDHAGRRYVVELDSEGKSEPTKLRIKPVNLASSGAKERKGKGQ